MTGSVLDRASVVVLVEQYAAVANSPKLSPTAVEQAVDAAARADADGLSPVDEGWTPTYDVNVAIAHAWELKAAEAASKFDLTVDGQTLRRSQVIAHCERQAARFRSRAAFVWPR